MCQCKKKSIRKNFALDPIIVSCFKQFRLLFENFLLAIEIVLQQLSFGTLESRADGNFFFQNHYSSMNLYTTDETVNQKYQIINQHLQLLIIIG